ncbi:MAG: sugar ABC transporter permease [Chloroflexota bacterium]|nr:sugar ABC transporter permease [Chloroflexota bacterium]
MVATTHQTGGTPRVPWRLREAIAAWAFLLPSLIPFVVFVAGPVLAAVALSFAEYDLLSPPSFIGLANFETFLSDPRILTIYKNTAVYVAGTVGIETIIALLLAVATNRALPGLLRYLFRTTYFFPVLTSLASVSIVWGYLYHTNFGVINYYLQQLGGPQIRWLTSSDWAMPALIILGVWKSLGFSYILFVAGLQNIPRHLYEAAAIDGAGPVSTFFNITLPMLSPTMFFAVVISLINGFQIFDSPYIMTQGGPGDATRTVAMYLHEQGFRFFDMGYAATISLSLFVVILILTLVQFRFGRSWVHYA